ncbi:hypothetical protein FRAAL0424 [Frankia alni ACN14a]|uniref:Uncharacterized protein n=1 Tax=Frankia alni (strain DSM 45986 / CECT 9034 / ACN14a) TaxID=326424 RepID=Q0RTJ9_FRAAA|nr:hypothetical protein FRAAL0424 [Frankia alni ACN14a]
MTVVSGDAAPVEHSFDPVEDVAALSSPGSPLSARKHAETEVDADAVADAGAFASCQTSSRRTDEADR